MIIKTFKRYEIKYFVTPEQYRIMQAELAKHMTLDQFCRKTGSYMIYNLYFDTDHDDIIRRSLAKPYYREKLRMRSYRTLTGGGDIVFLELKKKIGGIVAKRRASLTFSQAVAFAENGIMPATDNYKDRQVLAEIREFLNRCPAQPKVFISYERTAYFDQQNPDLRVSFDKNILARREDLNLASDYGAELLPADRILMEIKCWRNIPLWLSRLLASQKIYKTSFSKYGTEYTRFRQNKARTEKFLPAAIQKKSA